MDNPVYIDCPLFLHGGSQKNTPISANDPTQPIFIVRNAEHVNFTGISFDGKTHQTEAISFPNVTAVRIENTAGSPITFEMMDTVFRQTSIEIAGPGTFRLQGNVFSTNGSVTSAIELDDPNADLVIVGGDILNDPALRPHPDVSGPLYHVRQKAGRLQIYGTLVETTLGNADFRIDTAAGEPHVIASVRSEGVKNSETPFTSTLLFVPPSMEEVDVVLKNNSGSWGGSDGLAQLANYNARGTLWAIGNSAMQRKRIDRHRRRGRRDNRGVGQSGVLER